MNHGEEEERNAMLAALREEIEGGLVVVIVEAVAEGRTEGEDGGDGRIVSSIIVYKLEVCISDDDNDDGDDIDDDDWISVSLLLFVLFFFFFFFFLVSIIGGRSLIASSIAHAVRGEYESWSDWGEEEWTEGVLIIVVEGAIEEEEEVVDIERIEEGWVRIEEDIDVEGRLTGEDNIDLILLLSWCIWVSWIIFLFVWLLVGVVVQFDFTICANERGEAGLPLL